MQTTTAAGKTETAVTRAITVHDERMVRANGIDLRTQAFGDPSHPALLLIMGATASMKRWPEEFCIRLAEAGRFVIRYDNRDTGRSSVFPVGAPGYSIRDMADDAVGVLDAYGVERAHMAGWSMGGMITQNVAIYHPNRICSACLFGSTPDGSAVASSASGVGKARSALSAPPAAVLELLAFLTGVDWTDEAQAIDAWVREDEVLLGPGDTPDPALDRANVTILVREARNILAHRKNHGVVVATSYWRDRLKDIRTPTLMMHGTHDYCLPLDHAQAMANEIPDAKLIVVEGMGHVLSPNSRYWQVFADALIAHTASGTNPPSGDHRQPLYEATMKNGTITMNEGRMVGFADYGSPDQIAVLWCHGGPGNRLEPSFVADAAARAGLRLIGVDRPGYGRSTPQPGRTIGGWVPDALAVVDHLGIDRFVALGASTGGAYALALASHSSRAIGAVACCAVSDMRWREGKAMNVCCHPFWNARDRDEARALGGVAFGEHGEKVLPPHGPVGADASDTALYATPDFLAWWTWCVPEMFTNGVDGYVDDRLADADGWGTFDVARISCPVTVLHGARDGMIPVANAHHTAAIVPGARLRIFENLGHVSILTKAVEVTSELLMRYACAR